MNQYSPDALAILSVALRNEIQSRIKTLEWVEANIGITNSEYRMALRNLKTAVMLLGEVREALSGN